MSSSRLQMVKEEKPLVKDFEKKRTYSPEYLESKEAKAKYDRLWHLEPEQFSPKRNIREILRVERTLQLIRDFVNLEGKKVIDLGSGAGAFADPLTSLGAEVELLDVSSVPLKDASSNQRHEEHLPNTKMDDNSYDVVLCTELISHIPLKNHRLLMSEMRRILKKDGVLVFSTSLDIDTRCPWDKLAKLLSTEFDLERGYSSYHALQIQLRRLFKALGRFSTSWLKLNRSATLFLEKVSKLILGEKAVSHVIVTARPRDPFIRG